MRATMTTPSPLDRQAGYAPPRYRAAQRSSDALLEAGRELLRTRTIDAIPIQELCAHAGLTTGAFYGRFSGKDAYVQALLALAAHDIGRRLRASMARLERGTPDLRTAAGALLGTLRRGMRRHEGVLRASLHDPRHRETWAPFKQGGQSMVEQASPLMLRAAQLPDTPAHRARLRFAFQMGIATIVNALLNDPGPLRLSSPALEEELAVAFAAYVQAGHDPS